MKITTKYKRRPSRGSKNVPRVRGEIHTQRGQPYPVMRRNNKTKMNEQTNKHRTHYQEPAIIGVAPASLSASFSIDCMTDTQYVCSACKTRHPDIRVITCASCAEFPPVCEISGDISLMHHNSATIVWLLPGTG